MCTAKSHVRFTPNSDRESRHSLAPGLRANPKAALNRRLRCQRHNAGSPVAIARVPRKFISKISQVHSRVRQFQLNVWKNYAIAKFREPRRNGCRLQNDVCRLPMADNHNAMMEEFFPAHWWQSADNS